MNLVRFGKLEIGKEPKLLCTIIEQDVASSLAAVKKAISVGADCIELRIDRLREDSMVPELIKKVNFPALVVCRPKHLDGYFEGSEEERIKRLLLALDNKPDAIDIELTTEPSLRKKVIDKAKKNNVPVLIVYENFEKTPSKEELLKIYKEEKTLGADVIKFAVIANSYEDTLRVLDVALEAKKFGLPYVAIAMGKYGSISRPLACVFGSSMTYCAQEKGKEGAPGQLPVKETREIIDLLK